MADAYAKARDMPAAQEALHEAQRLERSVVSLSALVALAEENLAAEAPQ